MHMEMNCVSYKVTRFNLDRFIYYPVLLGAIVFLCLCTGMSEGFLVGSLKISIGGAINQDFVV